MTQIDPQHERQRLADFYSGQMDGELEQTASQATDLTDLAREALRNEMSRRGLRVELMEPAPPAPPPAPRIKTPSADLPAWLDTEHAPRDLVTLRQFRDMPEALLAKGCLDSAGIDSCLMDDNMVRLDWFWSNLVGGIKLQVSAEDADVAAEILDQPIPEGFEVAGAGPYEQPRCPKCQSLDVAFQELDPAAYLSMALSVPMPFHRRAWRCHSCRAEWEDDAEPESAS